LALAAGLLGGCETEKSYAEKKQKEREKYALRDPAVLVVTHHVGGTHHRGFVVDGVWYAGFGPSVLAISTETGMVLGSLESGPFGTAGPVRDLVAVRGPEGLRLVACLAPTHVVEIGVVDRINLSVLKRHRAAEIGFPPRALSVVDGEVWISGDRGAVRMADVPAPVPRPAATVAEREAQRKVEPAIPPRPFLAAAIAERGASGCGPVVPTAAGLAAPVGRRVVRLEDGSFLGAATWLGTIPPEEATRAGLPGDTLLFALQGERGATVGLMGPDVREIASGAVTGTVRSVRLLNGRVFALSDTEMLVFPIVRDAEGDVGLEAPEHVRVRGARDIARIGPNLYAVCGVFGRSFFRLAADATGPADTFFRAEREPAGLLHATSDGRRVLAGGPEGSWLYTIGGEAALVNLPIPVDEARRDAVSLAWCDATVASDRRSVRLRPKGPAVGAEGDAPVEITWSPRSGGTIVGVDAIDNRIWIRFDAGVQVFGLGRDGGILPDGAFHIDGPVRFLFPQRLGGAAVYVAEGGGFGVLDFIEREVLPDTPGARIVDLDGDGTEDLRLTDPQAAGPSRGNDRILLPAEIER